MSGKAALSLPVISLLIKIKSSTRSWVWELTSGILRLILSLIIFLSNSFSSVKSISVDVSTNCSSLVATIFKDGSVVTISSSSVTISSSWGLIGGCIIGDIGSSVLSYEVSVSGVVYTSSITTSF